MRLDGQQKMITLLFGLIVILLLGVMIFVSSKTETQRAKQIADEAVPVMATSTKANDLSSNGWWDAIPTAKLLPTMPGNTILLPITPTSLPKGTLSP
jgi:hypothetical protein